MAASSGQSSGILVLQGHKHVVHVVQRHRHVVHHLPARPRCCLGRCRLSELWPRSHGGCQIRACKEKVSVGTFSPDNDSIMTTRKVHKTFVKRILTIVPLDLLDKYYDNPGLQKNAASIGTWRRWFSNWKQTEAAKNPLLSDSEDAFPRFCGVFVTVKLLPKLTKTYQAFCQLFPTFQKRKEFLNPHCICIYKCPTILAKKSL